MSSIHYIGMDVHKENYTLCSYSIEEDAVLYKQSVAPDYKMVLKYLESQRKRYSDEVEFVCGYEAGCLGYTLYHQLTEHGIKCVILAPTTMAITNNNRIKTDKRDAGNIARCLAFRTYSEVCVPTAEDEPAAPNRAVTPPKRRAIASYWCILRHLRLILQRVYHTEKNKNSPFLGALARRCSNFLTF